MTACAFLHDALPMRVVHKVPLEPHFGGRSIVANFWPIQLLFMYFFVMDQWIIIHTINSQAARRKKPPNRWQPSNYLWRPANTFFFFFSTKLIYS